MIRFACQCRHEFTVDDDLAGTSIQCPHCGLLTDVPTHDDLPTLTPEGTYKVDEAPRAAEDPRRLAELGIVYHKGRVDDEGNEIDLRPKREDFEAVGEPSGTDDDADGGGDAPPPRPRPRYDPETGELIRLLDVKDEPERVDPASIPFAKPALAYAAASVARGVSPLRVLFLLFMPVNLFVMLFILCGQGAWVVAMVWASSKFTFFGSVFVWLQLLLLSHYGNVIDETGPEAHDELPRPWRDLRWHEDIWSPFTSVMAALFLCYAPAWACLRWVPGAAAGGALAAVMALAGTVAFPAVLLTLRTGVTFINLRPDRLLGTIRTCGREYAVAVLAWVAAAFFYLWSMVVFVELTAESAGWPVHFPGWAADAQVTLPALLCGIYFMHYFCWVCGLMYRVHHEQFPWAFQRHARAEGRVPVVRRSPRPMRRSRDERVDAIREDERQRRTERTFLDDALDRRHTRGL